MPAGRPSSYTPEIGEAICDAVAASQHGLRKTLENNGLPPMDTVQQWLASRGAPLEFKQMFADAKRRQIETMAEDIIDISMDDTLDPADKRIQVDTRKWLLSKLIPKTYGDKLDLTSDGAPLPTNSLVIDQRVQSILMSARARKQGQLETLSPDALKLLD